MEDDSSRMMRVRLGCFVGALCLVAAGCYGKHGAKVSGTVTLDGQRIGPGVVVFAPTAGQTNPARGAVQPDGSYFLKTSRDVGLAPGKYQVALQIVELPSDLVPGERDMRPTKSLIPQKYTDVATSGLEFDVARGGNTIDIEMKSN